MEENDQLMSDFFTHIELLHININKISEFIEEIKRLNSIILASPQDDDRTNRKLEKKMIDVKKLANDVRQRLKGK